MTEQYEIVDEMVLYIENTQYLSMWAPKVNFDTKEKNLGPKQRETAIRTFKNHGYVSYMSFWPIVLEAKKMYNKEFGYDDLEKNFQDEFPSVSFMNMNAMHTVCKELALAATEKLTVEGYDDW